jgi:hypothetical protein
MGADAGAAASPALSAPSTPSAPSAPSALTPALTSDILAMAAEQPRDMTPPMPREWGDPRDEGFPRPSIGLGAADWQLFLASVVVLHAEFTDTHRHSFSPAEASQFAVLTALRVLCAEWAERLPRPRRCNRSESTTTLAWPWDSWLLRPDPSDSRLTRSNNGDAPRILGVLLAERQRAGTRHSVAPATATLAQIALLCDLAARGRVTPHRLPLGSLLDATRRIARLRQREVRGLQHSLRQRDRQLAAAAVLWRGPPQSQQSPPSPQSQPSPPPSPQSPGHPVAEAIAPTAAIAAIARTTAPGATKNPPSAAPRECDDLRRSLAALALDRGELDRSVGEFMPIVRRGQMVIDALNTNVEAALL